MVSVLQVKCIHLNHLVTSYQRMSLYRAGYDLLNTLLWRTLHHHRIVHLPRTGTRLSWRWPIGLGLHLFHLDHARHALCGR